jgi:sugar lactone lactonase YvrE
MSQITSKFCQYRSFISLLLFMITLPCYGTIITTIAGDNIQGYQGDGGLALAAQLNKPAKIAIDKQGNLLMADTANSVIRQVNRYGIISTLAGTGNVGYQGDAGRATAAQLNFPSGLAVDSQGVIYIADTQNHVIRRVGTDGIITTLAGTGTAGYGGDYKTAMQAQLDQPTAIAIDTADNLYVADTGNSVIRKINSQGIITTVAGTGRSGMAGDGQLATRALLNHPEGIAIIEQTLYIADTQNAVVRVVDKKGIMRTFSGTGDPGSNSEVTAMRLAQFHSPTDIVADSQGNLYVADTGNSVIRKIDTHTDTVSIIAGNRTQGYSGDRREAIFAQLNMPKGIALDEDDRVYIADTNNHVIRKLSSDAADLASIRPRSPTYTTRVNQAPLQVAFLVTDALGNPLTAQEVTFFAPFSQVTPNVTKTDNQGMALTTLASYTSTGSYPLFAAMSEHYIATQTVINVQSNDPSPGVTPTSSSPQPPPVVNIRVSQGNNQRIPVKQAAETMRFVVSNASGALIRGQKVTFTVEPSATLSVVSAVTDTQGEVTTQFDATETTGHYVITARLDATTATTAQLDVFQPEPPPEPPPQPLPVAVPQTLNVIAGSGQIIATGQTSAPIQFRLKDSENQVMAGKTLQFSVTPRGQGLTLTTPTTDAHGDIELIFNAVDTIGDYLISAQVDNSLLTATAHVTVFKPVPVLTATYLIALKTSQVVEIDNTTPVYFTVLDNQNQPLAGQTVLFNLVPAANGLSVSQAVSDSQGQVSTTVNPTYRADSYTLMANVINTDIQASSVIHTFIADKPEPMQLSIAAVSGQDQQILLGQNSADITFKVTTPEGSPVVKRKVFFSLMPDRGKLAFTDAYTDMQGYVSTHLNSVTTYGKYAIVATISDTQTATTALLNILDARATLTTMSNHIQQLGMNTASAPIRFLAAYRDGEPIANQEVTFTLQPNGHGLTSLKATTDAQGQVTTQMQPTDLEGHYSVTAKLEGASAQAMIQVTTQPQTEMLTVIAGADQHILAGEPSQIITFTATDGDGQPLAGRAVNFTITPTTADLITNYARTDATGQVSTRLDKNAQIDHYVITATTAHTTMSTTVVVHPMIAAVMKKTPVASMTPDTTTANLSETGFFSGVFINNQLQENVPISAPTKIMVTIKDTKHTGQKTNIYITAKQPVTSTRTRAAATDTEWMLVQDTEQPQTWQWQPWDGELNNLQPTESDVYLAESVTQYEYPTEFPSEGKWAIAIGYSPPVADTETPSATPSNLITTEQTTAVTVENMPSLGKSAGLDKENNPITSGSLFSGGISIDNASYVREATTLRSRNVQIEGNVKVEAAHVGYLADIIIVVAYKETDGTETFYMMQNSNELQLWDGSFSTLLAFKENIELPSNYPITLYTGNLPVTGELRFYFGYRLSNGSLIFTPNSINAKVDDDTQMPALGATRELGKLSTNINSFFVGGVSQNGQTFATHATLPPTQSVQVTGVMNIAAEHLGKDADLLLVVGVTPPGSVSQQFFMQDAQQNFQSWQDLNPATLVAKQHQTLAAKMTVDLYNGVLPILGTVQFYFGYRLGDGSVFYPNVPIEIVVQ